MIFNKKHSLTRISIIAFSLLANMAQAESSIRHEGKLISKGDHINRVYQAWGKPTQIVSSVRTCGRIIKDKKTYCSSRRHVWKRGNQYWLVQTSGSMIIKIGWTRFQSEIAKEI